MVLNLGTLLKFVVVLCQILKNIIYSTNENEFEIYIYTRTQAPIYMYMAGQTDMTLQM